MLRPSWPLPVDVSSRASPNTISSLPSSPDPSVPQRAVSDSFGIVVRVLTSDLDNWYLTYEPQCCKMDREIFLTYIAPIHYNSIR